MYYGDTWDGLGQAIDVGAFMREMRNGREAATATIRPCPPGFRLTDAGTAAQQCRPLETSIRLEQVQKEETEKKIERTDRIVGILVGVATLFALLREG